jgi:SagB-type dehydrogenase family enzyme
MFKGWLFMKYSENQINEMIKTYRESLKPLWKKLHTEQTPRGKDMEKPSVVKTYNEGEIVVLSQDVNDLGKKSVYDTIMDRRSIRKYTDEIMSFNELSYLCKLTCHIRMNGGSYALGVVPTGGARNSLETYIYVNRVEDLESGLYHYMKDTGNLRLINKDITNDMVNESLMGQLRNANVVFYWTTIPYRSEYKYSFTAHKMIAMEAGHACQNLYLAAESIDYGVVALCAYNQEEADKLLSLNEEEFVVYAATVGKKNKE